MPNRKATIVLYRCPQKAEYVIETSVFFLRKVRCALCKECILKTGVYKEENLNKLDKIESINEV